MKTRETIAAELPKELADLDRQAERLETPCGDGAMVWRAWGNGPVLMLFHGGAGSWHHWVRNIPVLSRSYRIVAPDLPGLGESANPPEPHTPDEFARIIAPGLDQVIGATQTYDLVGFSFGGLIGAHLAALQPKRVRSLTIIGTGGLEVPNNSIEFVRLRDKTPAEQIEAHKTNLNRMMIADPANIDDLALAIHIRNSGLSRVKSPSLYALGRLGPIISELKTPVNGIWGERDPTAVPYIAEREALLRRLNPHLEFEVIEKAGHWVPFEAADRFNDTLLRMLRRSRPAGK